MNKAEELNSQFPDLEITLLEMLIEIDGFERQYATAPP